MVFDALAIALFDAIAIFVAVAIALATLAIALCLPPSSLLPLPSLSLPLLSPLHACHPCCHCHHLAALALSVACRPCCHPHHPLTPSPLPSLSPATLIAVAITHIGASANALIAVAFLLPQLSLPLLLLPLPAPSLLPATLVAITIAVKGHGIMAGNIAC
jgi:hypothetical protein